MATDFRHPFREDCTTAKKVSTFTNERQPDKTRGTVKRRMATLKNLTDDTLPRPLGNTTLQPVIYNGDGLSLCLTLGALDSEPCCVLLLSVVVAPDDPFRQGVFLAHCRDVDVVLKLPPSYVATNFVKPVVLQES